MAADTRASTSIVDAHSDLLEELAFATRTTSEPNPFASRWHGPLVDGGVSLQVCAIYTDPGGAAAELLEDVLRQAGAFHAAVAANPEHVVAVRTRRDLDGLGDRLGLLLALEGASCLGEAPWLLDVLAELGLRMCSLTWNERNAFASGCDHHGALTARGAELVDRLIERRIVIDLAHASPRSFFEILERSGGATVLVSHAACRAVHDHRRNLSDEQLLALADRGGVLGLMPHPLVVDPSHSTIERFLDHVDHAVTVMGIDHVGLGGDFMRQIMRAIGLAETTIEHGMRADAAIEGLAGPAEYPRLVEALRRRGYGDDRLTALLGGNLRRLIAGALPDSP